MNTLRLVASTMLALVSIAFVGYGVASAAEPLVLTLKGQYPAEIRQDPDRQGAYIDRLAACEVEKYGMSTFIVGPGGPLPGNRYVFDIRAWQASDPFAPRTPWVQYANKCR